MLRRATKILCFGALALRGAIGPAALHAEEKPFQETLDVHLVDVDVMAVDKSRNPVTDLAREDFQVTDDGKKVQVQYFAGPGDAPGGTARGTGETPDRGSARGPLQVILFVDLDSEVTPSRNRVVDEFSRRLAARAGDVSAMVVTYGVNGMRIEQPFSTRPEDWTAALAAATKMPSRGEQRRSEQKILIEQIEGVKRAEQGVTSERNYGRQQLAELIGIVRKQASKDRAEGLATLNALRTLSSALSTVPGPKSLVYVGDGVPVRPGEDLLGLLADLFEGERAIEQGGGFADAPPAPGTAPPPATGAAASRANAAGAAGREVGPTMESADALRSEAAALELTDELRSLTAIANSQRVTLYGLSSGAGSSAAGADLDLDLGGRASAATVAYDVARARSLDDFLQRLAEDTGGLAVGPEAPVETFVDRVLGDGANAYSLGYASPHGGDSRYHRIKVKVSRKGIELRHRPGYIDRARDLRIGDLVAGALLFGSGENPHQVELEVVSQAAAENGHVEVTIGVSLPMDALTLAPVDGRHEAKLELYVQSRDPRGALTPLKVVDLTVAVPDEQIAAAKGKLYGAHLPLVLARGPQTIAVGIVEPGAQRTSVTHASIEVVAAPAAAIAPRS